MINVAFTVVKEGAVATASCRGIRSDFGLGIVGGYTYLSRIKPTISDFGERVIIGIYGVICIGRKVIVRNEGIRVIQIDSGLAITSGLALVDSHISVAAN